MVIMQSELLCSRRFTVGFTVYACSLYYIIYIIRVRDVGIVMVYYKTAH